MSTSLVLNDVQPRIRDLVRGLHNAIPAGVGSSGAIPKLSQSEERRLLQMGAKWAIENDYGKEEDLTFIEDHGQMKNADPGVVSENAIRRGLEQVGTLGSGNHFVEIAFVDEIYRPELAQVFGLEKGNIVVSLHTGSRGFGYQICDDYVRRLLKAAQKYRIELPDRQLACAPIGSPEGKEYFAAMACAANYAWVNRQVIMALSEKALCKTLGMSAKTLAMRLLYDVCHNIAKVEEHEIDGKPMRVVVHRKGATRAFPPGHALVPEIYRKIGQPVLVPGDMGRYSFLCVGTEQAMRSTFGSACHGAGRVASRSKMLKDMRGHDLFAEMQARNVFVMAQSRGGLAEEMPEAYKEVEVVVDVLETAGITKKVARFKPIGVVKG
jgi:tRNA-splicing ligase RtcB